MNREENVILKDYSTLRVGGPARFFVAVQKREELEEAVRFAQDREMPFFVLGGGSNVYFGDKGFAGLVIFIKMLGVTYEEKESGEVWVHAHAGENWDALVAETVARGLWGLENLSLIPGSVGASPVQNIGAYGTEVKDVVIEVEAFDTESLRFVSFSNKDCRFSYRDSFFKSAEGKKFVVVAVTFSLSQAEEKNISYQDLSEYFEESDSQASLADVREAVIRIRQNKLPDPEKIGTLGSFFKNPIVDVKTLQKLQEKFPEVSAHEVEGGFKISAAWLIDKACGLKGYRDGQVGTYEKQPLALVNYGGATAEEVRAFAQKIKTTVFEKTNIMLEEEVNFVNSS